jgi:drug/metabolite transporter (DMT)-like permease
VPATALALTLTAAFLHAGWNLLLARAPDTQAATGVALLAGIAAGAPLAIGDWSLHAAALPWLGTATLFQLAYIVLLARAYSGDGELSVVYPLARGLGPVLVLVVGVTVLGQHASALQGAGVLAVAAGVLLVRGARLSVGSGTSLAIAIGVCIAGYTLADAHGIRHASSLTYVEVEMVLPAFGYLALLARERGALHLRRVEHAGEAALAGVAMIGGYALVLLALRRAPAPAVAAVRESSVVIATALAAVVLHEAVTRVRLLGSAVVVGGLALIALG